jgi:tRNA-specific 2-thiouridylase
MKKIAVGMSGGVDSSVVLLLLKEQGFDVTGVHMQCWDYNEEGCTGEQDKADAVSICAQLDVPFKFLDFQKEYQEKVIQNFYDEYNAGRTPNPDVLCNKEIKFGMFLDWALKNGFDAIATGHYAKIENTDLPRLFIPKDRSKDQTYFLYRLTSNQLSHIMFPLGELLKDEVKEIAFQNNLKNYNKPESMGICFIGKINVRDFLKRRIAEKNGNVLNTKGEVIGKHRGIPFYTIGQRHGFEIFKYLGTPQYILSKNAETNELVVGNEEEAKRNKFEVSDISFIAENQIGENNLKVRIRHLGELHPAKVIFNNQNAQVFLKDLVFGIAPGQSCVFYSENDQVLGGGIIV